MAEQSAYDILKDFFTGLGIQFDAQVHNVIKEAMEAGYGPDNIDLIMPDLQETAAFKKRFSGWHQRMKNGYNAISIGDYLQLENQYHRIMQEHGLPAGFYDDPADFGRFIANDVSPDELLGRVQMATNAARSIDPGVRQMLGRFYALGVGDLASYFLDPKRAMPVIDRQYKAAQIAAAAGQAGLNPQDARRYESLVDKGVTVEAALQGYGAVADMKKVVGNAASVYGESYTERDAEDDVFFNDSEKRRRIMGREAGTFGGSSSGMTGRANRQSY